MHFVSTSTFKKIIIPDTFSPLRSFSQTASSEEDNEEWRPSEPKTKTRKAARDPTAKQLKPLKRTAKRSEPKEVTEQDNPRDPKPTVSLHPAAEEKSKTAKDFKNTGESGLPGTETKQNNQGKKKRAVGANTKKRQTKCPEEQPATTSGPSDGIKKEVRQMAVRIFTTGVFLPFKLINNEFCFCFNAFFVFFFAEGVFYSFRSSADKQMLKWRIIIFWSYTKKRRANWRRWLHFWGALPKETEDESFLPWSTSSLTVSRSPKSSQWTQHELEPDRGIEVWQNILFVIYISSQTLAQKYRNWDTVAKIIIYYTALILPRYFAEALNMFGEKSFIYCKWRLRLRNYFLLLPIWLCLC